MTAPTLAQFILARIAEDERTEVHYEHCAVHWWECDCSASEQRERECEAKRSIVDEHPDYGGYGETCATCAEDAETLAQWPCPTLRALAAVYADHPDYRAEWKP